MSEETETPAEIENPSPGGIPRAPYDPAAPRKHANPAPETVDQAAKQAEFDKEQKELQERQLKKDEEKAEAQKQKAEEHAAAKSEAAPANGQ